MKLTTFGNKFNYSTPIVFICVVSLALLLRILFVDYPSVVVFDESEYATLISAYQKNYHLFQVHPPLARVLYGVLVRNNDSGDFQYLQSGDQYGEFPYIEMRSISAIIGAILIGIIFLILKFLESPTFISITAAMIVAIDPAFIVFSKLILPDMLLLLLVALSIFFYLLYQRKNRYELIYISLSAISIGLAISTKWTALGVAVVFITILLARRKFMQSLIYFLIILSVYSSIFVLPYLLINSPNMDLWFKRDDPKFSYFLNVPPVSEKLQFTQYIYQHHVFTFNLHRNYFQTHPGASHPLRWSFGGSDILLHTENGRNMIFGGNPILWSGSVIVILLTIFSLLKRINTTGIGTIKRSVDFLFLSGWAASYIPFFIATRAVFIYSYFIPLLFAVLLLPNALNTLKDFIEINPKKIGAWLLILSTIFYLFAFTTIYGW